ncbi:hypothetical protein DLAC_08884 [Tieghemostelium lacteum]|uniref:Uncharacterized protein n=1 Tax=Tieghemostelium lacteum TaxID=361077 RepID=A0A151Z8K7_TIELA|nr:hypothetical protein DLAC_08884 [Tieghemostelium lacteum]|eukprot:KYQ90282.1 hypothetical protein DLAC_08884 [Tieghemostelium lacteum]
MKYFIVTLLLLLFILIGTNDAYDQCLDYNGNPVDFWFILNKQQQSSDKKREADFDNVGYIYVDSNDLVIETIQDGEYLDFMDITNLEREDDDDPKSLITLIEQHTNTAFERNQGVYRACTITGDNGEQIINEKYATDPDCIEALKEFSAQTWYHDTLRPDELGGTGIKHLTEQEKNNRYQHQLALSAKRTKEREGKSVIFDNEEKEHYKKELGKKMPMDIREFPTELLYQPSSTFRTAHAKFLVSLDIETSNGYIIDHSVNIPSGVQLDENNNNAPFEEPKIFDSDQGTIFKFQFSQHFFCFNFKKDDFEGIMELIKGVNPKYVKSNYIHNQESFLDPKYNVKLLIDRNGEELSDMCSNFYNLIYTEAIHKQITQGVNPDTITSDSIVKDLLSVDVSFLEENECLKTMDLTIGEKMLPITMFGFNARKFPQGYDVNKKLSVHTFVKEQSDDIQMNYPHLHYVNYGIDPYTLIAKEFKGKFYVSTFPQSGRINVPTVAGEDFQILMLKEWSFGKARHEKLLFSDHSNTVSPGRVCIGDGNRNAVHTLYFGMIICFESITLTSMLNSHIEHVSLTNAYKWDPNMDFAMVDQKRDIGGGDETGLPHFVQSLVPKDTEDIYIFKIPQFIRGNGRAPSSRVKKETKRFDPSKYELKRKRVNDGDGGKAKRSRTGAYTGIVNNAQKSSDEDFDV